MKGLDEVARDIVGLFDKLGIPYAMMGGLAVRIHALPRPTFDVDFTAALPRDALAKLFQAAEEIGFTIPSAQKSGWVDTVRGLPVIKLQWFVADHAIDVDVFLAETPFQSEILSRRQKHAAEGWEPWFVTAEDLILLKLLADRAKDRTDVADILFVQGSLDMAYISTWAERLGIRQSLDSALAREPS